MNRGRNQLFLSVFVPASLTGPTVEMMAKMKNGRTVMDVFALSLRSFVQVSAAQQQNNNRHAECSIQSNESGSSQKIAQRERERRESFQSVSQSVMSRMTWWRACRRHAMLIESVGRIPRAWSTVYMKI